MRKVCSYCCGKGSVEVTGLYAETYDALKNHGITHAAELARKMGCSGPAMWMRLDWLHQNGFVNSRKHGRKTLYWVAE